MAITVSLKENGIENTSRRFSPGSIIKIYGTVYGKILPSPFQAVRVEVLLSSSAVTYEDSRTGLFGGYDFSFVAPTTNTAYTVRVSTTFPLGAFESKDVPIAIGSASPGDLPEPKEDDNFFTSLDTVLKILPFVVAILIVLFIYNQTKRR